jgi:hypothetical protein
MRLIGLPDASFRLWNFTTRPVPLALRTGPGAGYPLGVAAVRVRVLSGAYGCFACWPRSLATCSLVMTAARATKSAIAASSASLKRWQSSAMARLIGA